jgi:hypothetical protein
MQEMLEEIRIMHREIAYSIAEVGFKVMLAFQRVYACCTQGIFGLVHSEIYKKKKKTCAS